MWVQKDIPKHPSFDREDLIQERVSDIKNEIGSYLIEGLAHLIDNSSEILANAEDQKLWVLALGAQRYGVIYWTSRQDAKQNQQIIDTNAHKLKAIGDFLESNDIANQVFNFAVHKYVVSEKRNTTVSERLVPPTAISSIGKDEICVRQEDFFDKTPFDSLAETNPLYDLHDLSHQICSSIEPDLYGNKYFDYLIHLPSKYRNLVASPNINNERATTYSDGLAFTQFLTHLFNTTAYDDLTPDECVEEISGRLKPYYFGQEEILHPATGTMMGASRPITIEELATLVQNKFYELPASEMEQKLFVRGGNFSRGTTHRDDLEGVPTLDRLNKIASLDNEWLYFEKRNTIKHRSHMRTYERIVDDMLDNEQDFHKRDVLKRLKQAITYESHQKGKVVDFWRELDKTKPDYKFAPQINRFPPPEI